MLQWLPVVISILTLLVKLTELFERRGVISSVEAEATLQILRSSADAVKRIREARSRPVERDADGVPVDPHRRD